MTNEEKFVNELIGYIFAYPDDDYMTMECLCRKLHKYGLIDKADGHYQTHEIRTNTHECVKDTHDKTELTEPHIYGLFRKGELSDDDVKELKKRIGQIFEYADRKDEPQTNADQHVQHVGSVESVEPTWTKEEHEAFYTFLWNVINPNEMQDYIEMFETKDEPQTERSE